MGIFNFFRKKPKEEAKAKLDFNELEGWLNKEKKENKEKEKARLDQIGNMILNLVKELREGRAAIQKISLDEKDINERVKSIVTSSLSNLVVYLGELIKTLEKIKKDDFPSLITEINRIFVVFRQKSAINYTKASFVMDKELRSVNESIRKFLTGMNWIVEQEKSFVQRITALGQAENSMAELEGIERLISGANEKIEKIRREKKSLEERKQSIERNAIEIKESREYNEEKNKKLGALSRKNEVEMKIIELRGLIDFKSLAKTFHENGKKMNVIKSYEHDFSQIFENDADLLNLLDGDKRGQIKERIAEINQMNTEIQGVLGKKDRIEELKSEIAKTENDLKIIDSDKMKEQNKLQKFDDNLKAKKNEIIKILARINIELSQ